MIEKAVVMGLATGNKKGSTSLSDLVTSYASILAAQVTQLCRLLCRGCDPSSHAPAMRQRLPAPLF